MLERHVGGRLSESPPNPPSSASRGVRASRRAWPGASGGSEHSEARRGGPESTTLPTKWGSLDGPAGSLSLHVAPGSSTRGDQANVLVLCHGFPVERDSAERVADTLPTLADRIADRDRLAGRGRMPARCRSVRR